MKATAIWHEIRIPARAAPVLPTLAVGGCVWALAWWQRGSIAGTDWLPALIGLALLVAVVLAFGGGLKPGRVALVALGGLLASAAWAGASATWSPAPALARDEAALRCLYATAFAVPR